MTEKLLRDARRMIADSGVMIEVREARNGKQHHEFFYNGLRVFTLSKGPCRGRDLDKLRSAINRAAVS